MTRSCFACVRRRPDALGINATTRDRSAMRHNPRVLPGSKNRPRTKAMFSVAAMLVFVLRFQDNVFGPDKGLAAGCLSSNKGPRATNRSSHKPPKRQLILLNEVREPFPSSGSIRQSRTLSTRALSKSLQTRVSVKHPVKMPTVPPRTLPSRSALPSPKVTVPLGSRVPKTPSPPTTLWISADTLARRQSSHTITVAPPKNTEHQHTNRSGNARYVSSHMGEPCTVGSLDHLLSCGHKVITRQPEACATNCVQPCSSDVNPRALDEAFTCVACIVDRLMEKNVERVRDFRSELEQVAKVTKKPDPQGWIAQKFSIMAIAWRHVDAEELFAQSKHGRFCHAIYVEADYEDLVNEVVRHRELVVRKGEAVVTLEPQSTTVRAPSKQIAKAGMQKAKLPQRSPPTSPTPASRTMASSKTKSRLPSPHR